MPPSIPDLVLSAANLLQSDGIGVPVDPDAARERAQDILSRPEYKPPPESLLDRVFGWIGERFADLLLNQSAAGARGLITYILVGGLVAFVTWILVRSMRAPGRSSVKSEAAVTYGTENVRGPDVWQAEADRLAAVGDFRGALRCRHQALIATWIVGGVIEHVVGQTAQECHDAARPALETDPQIGRDVVDGFDAVWYGGRSPSAEDYNVFSARCDTLAAATRTRSRSGARA